MEETEKKYYAYMLRCADGTLYSGYTTDLKRRLKAHNSAKGAKYTRVRLPVALAYFETFGDKSGAMKREAELKKLTKAQKEALIAGKRENMTHICAMRRTDREIKDIKSIYEALERCEVIRLGLCWGKYPYIVPLSFGCCIEDGKIAVYFHGAKTGLKHELIKKSGKACVETDAFLGYKKVKNGVTALYESVIGFGSVKAAEGDEAVKGIELLLEHCGFKGEYDAASCAALGVTGVYKIVLECISGKRNIDA